MSKASADIVRAALEYREACLSTTKERLNESSASHLSGLTVLDLVAKEAARRLNDTEVKQFLLFFQRVLELQNLEDLEKKLTTELESFYAAELKTTSEGSHTLVRPSGKPDSKIGLILHCQTKDPSFFPEGVKEKSEFWDPDSQTIALLQGKGVKVDEIFGYDLHWRREDSIKGRLCPARAYSKEQRHLHNELSFRILEILPLPFVLVSGACPRKEFAKRQSPRNKRLDISTAAGTTFVIDLDFGLHSLRRIICYVDHPSAFYFNSKRAPTMCAKLDMVLNFILWLNGISHVEDYFTAQSMTRGSYKAGTAPVGAWYRYHELELNENRILRYDEYKTDHLIYAKKYLQRDFHEMSMLGQSIAAAVTPILRMNQRQSMATRFGHSYYEIWHNREVKITTKGTLHLYTSLRLTPLKAKVGLPISTACEEKGQAPLILFSPEGVSLMLDHKVICHLARDHLSQLKDCGGRWLEQIDKEVAYQAKSIGNTTDLSEYSEIPSLQQEHDKEGSKGTATEFATCEKINHLEPDISLDETKIVGESMNLIESIENIVDPDKVTLYHPSQQLYSETNTKIIMIEPSPSRSVDFTDSESGVVISDTELIQLNVDERLDDDVSLDSYWKSQGMYHQKPGISIENREPSVLREQDSADNIPYDNNSANLLPRTDDDVNVDILQTEMATSEDELAEEHHAIPIPSNTQHGKRFVEHTGEEIKKRRKIQESINFPPLEFDDHTSPDSTTGTSQIDTLKLDRLRSLIDYDMSNTQNVEVMEAHHIVWCLKVACGVGASQIGRPSGSTVTSFLCWRDIVLESIPTTGKFSASITFRKKSARSRKCETPVPTKIYGDSQILYQIHSPDSVDDIVFSVPHRLLVTALRRKIIDGIDSLDQLFTNCPQEIPIKEEHLDDPIVFKAGLRGRGLTDDPAQDGQIRNYLGWHARDAGFGYLALSDLPCQPGMMLRGQESSTSQASGLGHSDCEDEAKQDRYKAVARQFMEVLYSGSTTSEKKPNLQNNSPLRLWTRAYQKRYPDSIKQSKYPCPYCVELFENGKTPYEYSTMQHLVRHIRDSSIKNFSLAHDELKEDDGWDVWYTLDENSAENVNERARWAEKFRKDLKDAVSSTG